MNSRDFIKLLDEYELNVFDEKTILRQTGLPYIQWKHLTRSLLRNGLIQILEKGQYVRHNFSDEKIIGSFVVEKGTLAYWSALNFHGFTTQIPNTVFIQSPQRKKSKYINNVFYKFINIPSCQHVGIEVGGIGNNIFYYTDIEKTILDCLHKPEYSGELPEIIKAIAQAKLSSEKLISYSKAMNNKAIVQRLAYYLEIAGNIEVLTFLEFAKTYKSKGYALLDPKGIDNGKYTTKWNLRLNIPEEDVNSIMKN